MSIITPEHAGEIRGRLVEQYGGTWLHEYHKAIEAEVAKHYEDALAIISARSYDALRKISDIAHDASTGPAVPDTYWEIRNIAQEAL